MGRALLSLGKVAKAPYIIRKLDIAIYTPEELCYCIRENTLLFDGKMDFMELANWLGSECSLADLRDELFGLMKKKAETGDLLIAILEYVEFYPEGEIRRIAGFLRSEEGLDEYGRQKKSADYLAGSGKYELALEQYGMMLAIKDLSQEQRATIYHNMGCICGRMFSFEQAAKLYQTAYELSGDREDMIEYLSAKRLSMDEKEYVDFLARHLDEYHGLSEELERKVEEATSDWPGSQQEALFLAAIGGGEDEGNVNANGNGDHGGNGPADPRERLLKAAARLKEIYRGMAREK